MTTVAFQGDHGAFSEEAIYQYYGQNESDTEVETLPCRAFEHIFEAAENGRGVGMRA